MPRMIKLFLMDILQAINNIKKSTEKMDYDAFLQNSLVQRAVCWDLLTLGEAVKKIPADIRKQHPFPHWKEVAGLRDILAHEYFTIDLDIIWNIIVEELNELKIWIEKISESLPA